MEKMDVTVNYIERKAKQATAVDITLLAIFSGLLGMFSILAWIVPYGHITMEFVLNILLITYFRLKRFKGSLLLAGILSGMIDAFSGLGGAGFFLSPIVYGFRYGFLELVTYKAGGKNASNKFITITNAVGYFLTSTLIFVMYAMIGIPLGDALTQKMWFAFAAVGSIMSIPATILALKVFDQKIFPHLKSFLT